MAADQLLSSPFAFSAVTASLPLGTWNKPGLEYFSGRMIYEKILEIPPDLLAEWLLLDCGMVGMAVEGCVMDVRPAQLP